MDINVDQNSGAVTAADAVRGFYGLDGKKAQEAVGKAQEHGVDMVSSLPEDGQVPEGSGIAVLPMFDGKGKSAALKRYAVASYPTLESLLADENGAAWVEKIVNDKLASSIKSAAAGGDRIPVSIADFTISRKGRSGSGMGAYNVMWNTASKALGKLPRGAGKGIDKSNLRNCLMSASYAKAFRPVLEENGIFDRLLDLLISAAPDVKDKDDNPTPQDASVFQTWKETRVEHELSEEDELDFDLENLTLE